MIFLGVYFVMLKKFVFVYRIGKFGCVVFDIMNVCWNVESVFLIFCEIFGRLEGWFVLFFVFDVFDVLMDVVIVGSVIDICFVFLFFFELFYYDSYVRLLVLY